MKDFQLKYGNLNREDFYSLFMPDYKKSKYERLFNRIITPKHLEKYEFEELISMKALLKYFTPKKQDLKDEISKFLEQVQKALDTKVI